MIKRMLAILSMLCACLGTAHAQDQNEIFLPQGHFSRVKDMASGREVRAFTRFAGIERVRMATIVEFIDLPASTSEPSCTVNLRITDSDGGIGLVRVFLNGSAVIQDNTATPSGGSVTRSYTVQLASGPNELRAVASNADDSMSNSAVATIIANLPGISHATLHAVVVGIQEFKNPQYSLYHSVADAQLIADTLRKYSAPLFQSKADIQLLTTPAETTRDSLVQTLKNMQSVANADDLFIFYVASYGVVLDNGEYILITSNIGSGSTDMLKTEALSQADLTALLVNIPATKKLLLFDTTHGQAAGHALVDDPLSYNASLKSLSRAVGMTVMAAGTSNHQDALPSYQGHGLFAYVLADGLMGKGDVDKSGFVTTFGLADYVIDQVSKLAYEQFKAAQSPIVETNGHDFPLTKVR